MHRIHLSLLLTQRKWYMPPVFLDWQRFFVTETEQTLAGTGPLGATAGVPSGLIRTERPVTARAFLFQNQESSWKLVLIAPSEPG
jgi:hypothetical protein